jgi:hypothetical protein
VSRERLSVPSFLADPSGYRTPPAYVDLFNGMHKTDHVLVNSFVYELQRQALYM